MIESVSQAKASPLVDVVRSDTAASSPDEVLRYEHPALVARLQDKLGITREEAEGVFMDTKRFLYLCSVSDDPISPSEVIDFGWHEFILFTEDYMNFCDRHFGHYLHHRPRHPDDPASGREGSKRALRMARQFFGDELSKNWEYPEGLSANPCDSCGCSAACTDG